MNLQFFNLLGIFNHDDLQKIKSYNINRNQIISIILKIVDNNTYNA